jgi:hypothetical protein
MAVVLAIWLASLAWLDSAGGLTAGLIAAAIAGGAAGAAANWTTA